MGRGFLSGIIFGLLLSGAIMVIASRTIERVELVPSAPETGEAELPPGSEFEQERADVEPVVPEGDTRPVVDAPTAVEAPSIDTAGTATPDTAPAELPETTVTTEEPQAPGEEIVIDAPATTEATDPEVPALAGGAPEAPATDTAPEPAPAPEAIETVIDDTAPEGGETEPAEADVALPTTDTAPEIPSVDTPPATLPQIDDLALATPEIGSVAPEIGTDTLPSIGNAPAAAAMSGTALESYALEFDAPAGTPMIAIVLLDDPSARPDLSVLGAVPFPLTIGIDPTAEDAAAAMASYRASGQEVAVLTPLPEAASPADVEVAFQAFLSSVPEAVAVLDVPEALLQESRPRASQVVTILKESGHGLITYDKGLNSGLQIAERDGVPAVKVFRVFDDSSQNVSAMKRFLDQGAFRAGVDGSLVMVGQLRAETITALAEWSLGNRAASVSLAPISAVLRAAGS